jgi:hypothetical protein
MKSGPAVLFCLDENRFAYSLAALAASMIFCASCAGTSS